MCLNASATIEASMQPTSRQPSPFTMRKNDLEVWTRFPLSWYERTFLYTGVGISTGLMLQLFFWRSWGFLPPSWLSSLAAICYVVGFLFNFVSTHLPIRLKSAFDERGLRMNSCAGNLLLAAYPTWAQQIWNVSTLYSLLFIPLVAMMPGVGFGAFILHGLAGMGNYRDYRRSLLTLNLFDTCERSAAKDDGGGGGFQKRMNGSGNAPKGKLRGAV